MSEIAEIIQRLAAPLVCWFIAVLIHEAGHALAGCLAGRKPTRILIGLFGKPHGIITCCGVPIIFLGWPWSGFVFFRDSGTGMKTFWILAAGPLAGFAAAALVVLIDKFMNGPGFSIRQTNLVSNWQTWLVLTNLWAAVSNLWPSLTSTKNYGMLASDGLQIIRQFRPGWTPPANKKKDGTALFLIALTFAAGIGCLAVAIIAAGVALHDPQGSTPWIMPALMLFFLGLSILTFSMAGRELRRNRVVKLRPGPVDAGYPAPLNTTSGSAENHSLPVTTGTTAGESDLRKTMKAIVTKNWLAAQALISYRRVTAPEDTTWISLDLHCLMSLGDHAGGLALCRTIALNLSEPNLVQQAAVDEVCCLSALGMEEEAGKAIGSLPLRFPDDTATLLLDHIATQALIRRDALVCVTCLPLVKQRCEERSDQTSLRGTLGGILAELGHYREARPVLEQVLKTSSSLADLGITSLILGEVASKEGRTTEAAKLARKALQFYDAEWVSTRAKALLSRINPAA